MLCESFGCKDAPRYALRLRAYHNYTEGIMLKLCASHRLSVRLEHGDRLMGEWKLTKEGRLKDA